MFRALKIGSSTLPVFSKPLQVSSHHLQQFIEYIQYKTSFTDILEPTLEEEQVINLRMDFLGESGISQQHDF